MKNKIEVGDTVEIIDDLSGHRFELGDWVTVMVCEGEEDFFDVTNGIRQRCCGSSEIKLIKKHNE